MYLKSGSLVPTLIKTHTHNKENRKIFQRTLEPLWQFPVRKPGHLTSTSTDIQRLLVTLYQTTFRAHIFKALEGYKPSLQSMGVLRVRTFIQVDISSSRSVVKVSLRYIFSPADMCANSLIVE